jgi:hypothetical protein
MIFMIITFSTATSIPIISTFRGADAYELSQQRGDLLKSRAGIESALLYLSSFYTYAFLPYSLTHAFITKAKYRKFLFLIFITYTISSLQKALFVSVIFPMLYVAMKKWKLSLTKILFIIVGSLALLYSLTMLASGSSAERPPVISNSNDYFSASYVPTNELELLAWRSAAVPIFTATDTLRVFHEQFNDKPLLGSTSSFLSTIFFMERVPLERLVFTQQFGGWNDIANANAVFFVDAYVNFGWFGVAIFSLFLGQTLRWFNKSMDEAFKSLWSLYCFSLFSASLIGMLLGNGYLAIFFLGLFVKTGSTKTTETN